MTMGPKLATALILAQALSVAGCAKTLPKVVREPVIWCAQGDKLCQRANVALVNVRDDDGWCGFQRVNAAKDIAKWLGKPAAPYMVRVLGYTDSFIARVAAAVLVHIGRGDLLRSWCGSRKRRPFCQWTRTPELSALLSHRTRAGARPPKAYDHAVATRLMKRCNGVEVGDFISIQSELQLGRSGLARLRVNLDRDEEHSSPNDTVDIGSQTITWQGRGRLEKNHLVLTLAPHKRTCRHATGIRSRWPCLTGLRSLTMRCKSVAQISLPIQHWRITMADDSWILRCQLATTSGAALPPVLAILANARYWVVGGLGITRVFPRTAKGQPRCFSARP